VALILDTNALSAAADNEPAAWKVVAQAERLFAPVIVLGEYRLGISQSRHKSAYETWLREWISAVNVLDIDDETTHSYAAIGLELKKKDKPIRQRPLDCRALPSIWSSSLEPRPPFRCSSRHSSN